MARGEKRERRSAAHSGSKRGGTFSVGSTLSVWLSLSLALARSLSLSRTHKVEVKLHHTINVGYIRTQGPPAQLLEPRDSDLFKHSGQAAAAAAATAAASLTSPFPSTSEDLDAMALTGLVSRSSACAVCGPATPL